MGSPPMPSCPADPIRRCTIIVEGVVQGVGFRPFVYRLAERHGLGGSVRNGLLGVVIDVEGAEDSITRFLEDLSSTAPPTGSPGRLTQEWGEPRHDGSRFAICPSDGDGEAALFPPPDVAACETCLRELSDPTDRRYGYPFLNCTACGPRFTIIRELPYDRARTTMDGFAMCRVCAVEHSDPCDRRFHAEPIACAACGPRLTLLDADGRAMPVADPIREVAAALRTGRIVALKGLGGYHLACDATSNSSVRELRRRKGREAKPFAVMARSLDVVRALCAVSDAEAELLTSPARPIVLLARDTRPGTLGVAADVAPGCPELGVMLPYTPLHALVLDAVDVPLVMTSGNRSDEPIACEDRDALARLGGIADLFLVHDRPIHARCDDSVARVVHRAPLLLRRSRGYVPLALRLPVTAPEPILALGGELKSTFALVRRGDAFLSQHLGDLTDERSYRAFIDAIAHFRRLFGVDPRIIAHDLHPGYRTTAYAESLAGVERVAVQHHHAHIASCLADNGVDQRVIGVAWDGTGYGADGRVWGGEFLVADLQRFERAGHLENVPLPGGEAAIRQPWRMAAAFLKVAYGERMEQLDLACLNRLDRPAWRILSRAIERSLNAPLTSSAGRLFDALASLLGLRDTAEFEAQAAMELEAHAASEADRTYPVALAHEDGRIVVPTSDIVRGVVEDLLADVETSLIAARFHGTLAEVIATVSDRIRERTGLGAVALSGGVFQNVWLLEATIAQLSIRGFEVYTHRQVPPNDGGLALGQAAIAVRRLAERGSA